MDEDSKSMVDSTLVNTVNFTNANLYNPRNEGHQNIEEEIFIEIEEERGDLIISLMPHSNR